MEMSIDEQIEVYKNKIRELRASRVCSYCGTNRVYAKGLCVKCYSRNLRNGSPALIVHQGRKKKAVKLRADWHDVLCDEILGGGIYFVKSNDFNETVEDALHILTEREQSIVIMRVKDGATLEEIGKEYSVTRERVRQIYEKALRKMRLRFRSNWFVLGKQETNKINDRIEAEKQDVIKREIAKRKLARAARANYIEAIALTSTPIERIGLSVRAYNCLYREGCRTSGDIAKYIADNGEKLMQIRNLGRKTASEIMEKMNELVGVSETNKIDEEIYEDDWSEDEIRELE